MSLNIHELFLEMAKAPQVEEAVAKKAEQVRDQLETRWHDMENVSQAQRDRLRGDQSRITTITKSTRSNRPTHVVTVRHPGAVAKQAKDGFVTKAVKAVGG